uniref:DUF2079 domain-containing protein n=1 Tax=mine drainage metagenome TaxID=410659 RepID=E6PH44_9ZZZZ
MQITTKNSTSCDPFDTGFWSVSAWTVGVALLIGIFTIIRWSDWNYGYDLGIFSQVVYNVPRGFVDQPEFGTHFHYHFAPILAVLWPIMALFKSPLVLQWAAIVLVCAATPMLYVLFRPYTDERTSVRIALCSLFNPFLYSQAFNEFHELCFLPVLAIALLWALDRERWVVASILAVLLFCVREDAAITGIVALLVVTVLAWRQSRIPGTDRRGLLLGEPLHARTAMSVSLLLACTGTLIIGAYFAYAKAYLGGWEPATFYRYSFASTPLGVVVALFLQPTQSWPTLATIGRAGYLFEALICTLFLPVRSRWLFLALPGLAIVLLANSIGVWRIGAQYALLWVPWLMVAFGEAVIRIAPDARGRWFLGCASVLAAIALVGNPLHLGTYLRPSYGDLADARRALARVGNVALSTHDEWQTHISVVDPLANSVLSPTSQWFVYASDYPNKRFQTIIKPEIERMVRDGVIRVVAQYGNVVIYRRIAATKSL